MSAEGDRKYGRTEGGRFAPGSGGRKPGSQNRTTLAALALIEGQAEQVVQALVTAAVEEGDVTAGKVLLNRIAPPVRSRRRPAGSAQVRENVRQTEALVEPAARARIIAPAPSDGSDAAGRFADRAVLRRQDSQRRPLGIRSA